MTTVQGISQPESVYLGFVSISGKNMLFFLISLLVSPRHMPGCSKCVFWIVEMHTLMQKKIWMKNIFSSWRFLILKILIFWKKIWFFKNRKFQLKKRFFQVKILLEKIDFSIEIFDFWKNIFFSENQNFQNTKSSRWKNIFHSDFFLQQGIHLYYPKNTVRATSDTSKDVQTMYKPC